MSPNCCCGEPPLPCDYCTTDDAPAFLNFVFSNIANGSPTVQGSCQACTCANGEALAAENNGSGSCAWTGTISLDCFCLAGTITAALTYSGGHYYLTATLTIGGTTATYQADLGTEKPDCEAWSGIALSLQSSSGTACDLSTSSLAVTASNQASSSVWPSDPATQASLMGATWCDNCGSDYPERVYVRLSGLTNEAPGGAPCWNCQDCESLNGTYSLRHSTGTVCLVGCGWTYSFGSPICAVASIGVALQIAGVGAARAVWLTACLGVQGGPSVSLLQSNLGAPPVSCAAGSASGGFFIESVLHCNRKDELCQFDDYAQVDVWW